MRARQSSTPTSLKRSPNGRDVNQTAKAQAAAALTFGHCQWVSDCVREVAGGNSTRERRERATGGEHWVTRDEPHRQRGQRGQRGQTVETIRAKKSTQ